MADYYPSSPKRNTNPRNYNQPQQQAEPIVKPTTPTPLPANYVDVAEAVIQSSGRFITTSKLRNFLALVTDIYNVESIRTGETLDSGSQQKLMRLRIRIVYDAGRDKDVAKFVQAAHLLDYLAGLGNNRIKMIQFAHYMEALVAYHRYLGGKEK